MELGLQRYWYAPIQIFSHILNAELPMKFSMSISVSALIISAALLSLPSSQAEEVFSYQKTPVKDGIVMLHGAGGNIAVLNSARGLLVIDNGFDSNSAALQEALDAINSETQFVLNTHWHGDHTGANEALGSEATVMAHTNVRVRMSDAGKSQAALPLLTYDDGTTLHFAEQTVKAVHLAKGHTDGDTVVRFVESNVLHTGDLMFNGKFPFIDKNSGGSIDGYIANVQKIIDMIDEQTIVIPGHGVLANRADLGTFKSMIETTRAQVAKMKASGMSMDEAKEKGLGEEWTSWGDFFIKEGRWIETLWTD